MVIFGGRFSVHHTMRGFIYLVCMVYVCAWCTSVRAHVCGGQRLTLGVYSSLPYFLRQGFSLSLEHISLLGAQACAATTLTTESSISPVPCLFVWFRQDLPVTETGQELSSTFCLLHCRHAPPSPATVRSAA